MRTVWNVSIADHSSLAFPSNKYFWILSFAYSSCMALLVQKLLLPMWPAMHAGHGLLEGDAILFHNQAVQISQQIRTIGWKGWSLFSPEMTSNVGLLAALYAMFSPDPAWFIPFNAAAHATGALIIYRLGTSLTRTNAGRLGGLVAAICFLVFPSALLWYSQLHKDAFTIAGSLLVLEAWLEIEGSGEPSSWNRLLRQMLKVLIGVVLVGLFRPYLILLLLLGLLASLLVVIRPREKMVLILTRMALILVVAASAFIFARVSSPSNALVYGSKQFYWQDSSFIPALVDKGLRRASELREHLIEYGASIGAGSNIDSDRTPHTAMEAVEYLPRALFVGLFSPFPITWGERMTTPRLVAAMETAVWYLMALGALVTLYRFRSRNLFAGAIFCATILSVIAYVSPNVGTIYRLRYGLWFFFMLIGTVGWSSVVLDYLPEARGVAQGYPGKPNSPHFTAADAHSIVHQSGSGPVVMLMALVSFLGFLTRDVVLIGKLGFASDIDIFFAISAISMFFVNSLSVPLGEVFVPLFVAAQRQVEVDHVRLLRGVLGFAVLVLTIAWIAVELLAPWLVKLVLGSPDAESQAFAAIMLRRFSPVILLSSWTVIGNAVLNSLGRPIQAAQAYLVVPFFTLMTIILAPQGQAVHAAIGGMVVGTFANALVVAWRVRTVGYTLLPGISSLAQTQVFRSQYWPLLVAAMLPGSLVPLNYYFAASAGTGTLSAWAIASKIVTLFASLANVGATAIILPRLSYAFSNSRGNDIRQQANFYVAIGVWLGGLVMLGGFLFVRPICISLLGGNLGEDQIAQLVGIITVCLVQIPMTISSAMVNRLVIASGRSLIVMQAAALAFAGNVLADTLLVPKFGVIGVAVGALIGTSLSAAVVLASAQKSTGLTFRDLFVALASWLIWITLCASLFINNTAAILISGILLLGAAAMQLRSLQHGNENTLVY